MILEKRPEMHVLAVIDGRHDHQRQDLHKKCGRQQLNTDNSVSFRELVNFIMKEDTKK
jgi:hypothetical protein